jgi:uncharacterized protein YqgV (UPF0045/DUF77 family)
MVASAQISVYPLRQEHLAPAINMLCEALAAHGLNPQTGPMSTHVVGEAEAIFAALAQGFAAAAEAGEVVMAITVSNACPIPG